MNSEVAVGSKYAPVDQEYQFSADHRLSPAVRCPSRLYTSVLPCLTGIGSLYQKAATVRDQRDHPAPGTLMGIGSCSLHVQTAGSGTATVVLETGLGGMSCAWAWIQPETAKFARVISYDRAGLGWSESDASPRTASLAVQRLHAILEQCGAKPPYIMVGHSMGGMLVRVFADRYREEVAGMVLIDAAHPDQHLRSAAIRAHMFSGFRLLKAIPLLARLGYVRLTGLFNAWAVGLPPRQAAQAVAFLSSERHLTATRDESLAWEGLCEEVRQTRDLGAIPLAVVSAGRDVLPGHPELQGELAALSSDSTHLVVPGADHVTLVTRREPAREVVRVIRDVIMRGTSSWGGEGCRAGRSHA